MIYTLTFSPSIDYIINIDTLTIGDINRSKNDKFLPGGKGINVSIILSKLNRKSIIMGFLGGFSGNFIKDELDKLNIENDFININGISRINVKIEGNKETAINGSSPNISKDDIDKLIIKLNKLNENDILIISGNVPDCVSIDVFNNILNNLHKKNVEIIVDNKNEILMESLKYQPLLVKPNKEELEETFNVKLDNDEDIIKYAHYLKDQGAKNVIVSLGDKGAILIDNNNHVYKEKAKLGKVINTVGAGDALVAGFIDEYLRSNDAFKAFKFGIDCSNKRIFGEDL